MEGYERFVVGQNGEVLISEEVSKMTNSWHDGPEFLIVSTVRAPVFDRHQFFGTSEHYRKAHAWKFIIWLNELWLHMHVAGFLHPVIIWYFHQSSDKSGLKVTNCTVQSAEYWCSYGRPFFFWGGGVVRVWLKYEITHSLPFWICGLFSNNTALLPTKKWVSRYNIYWGSSW